MGAQTQYRSMTSSCREESCAPRTVSPAAKSAVPYSSSASSAQPANL